MYHDLKTVGTILLSECQSLHEQIAIVWTSFRHIAGRLHIFLILVLMTCIQEYATLGKMKFYTQ